MAGYGTLSEVLADLEKRGFTPSFGGKETGVALQPDDFEIVEFISSKICPIPTTARWFTPSNPNRLEGGIGGRLRRLFGPAKSRNDFEARYRSLI